MAITLNPFFSKYGFKGPGFSVDSEGNVTVKSLNSEQLITTIVDNSVDTGSTTEVAVTEVGGDFIFDGDTANPNKTFTVTKGRTYKFTLNLSTLFFNIRDANALDVGTGITHVGGGVTTTGAEANNKQDGYITWEVPTTGTGFTYADIDNVPSGQFTLTDPTVTGTGTFSSLIVTGTSELRDSLTVNAQTDLNGLLNVNDTTESTTSTTGALVVDGGVGIAKNLNVEGDIIARTFKNTDVGIPTLESSSNLNLSAKNSIVVNIDGVEEGRITSDGINLRIINTTINDTPIGNSGPSTGTFTEVTLKNNGTAPDNAVQKSYVDSGDIVFSIAFGA
tara:strand:- start:445 stop:1446 length:1002 start_codon:yes stop_codon:yes gene_type:complete